jgi:uncharacterized protein
MFTLPLPTRIHHRHVIEGYASLFDRADLAQDVIVRGAFARSLLERGPRGIKLLLHHDPQRPIGVWDFMREDHRGLYVRGHLVDGLSVTADTRALLAEGALDGLSIGFLPLRFSRSSRAQKARTITHLDLLEISLVTFPMMPGARARLAS